MNSSSHPRLAALLLCLATLQALGQRQWATFDDGFTSSEGLGFTFARAADAFLPTGERLGPDQPRYLPDTLFCAPVRTDVLEYGQSINALASGDSGDGRPMFLINSATLQRLSVHTGQDSVTRAFGGNNWSGVYQLSYHDFNKDGLPNLLRGQSGRNDGTPDQPTTAFAFTGGGAIHNGLVVVALEAWDAEGDGWLSRRVALGFTWLDRLSEADPWIIAAVAPATDPNDTTRGAPWSVSSFPISDDEIIVTWTDYRAPAKTGGQAFATRFLRDAGAWTAETVMLDSSDSSILTEHWHCAGLIRHPDGRDSVLISTGDGGRDNSLIATTLAAGGAWSSGVPVADSGIDERSLVYEPSADWTPPATVWGGRDPFALIRHNQVISMISGDPDHRTLLCGADETNNVVLGLSYDPDEMLPAWRSLSLPTVTSWPLDGALNFSMQGMPGGPYLGRIDASESSQWQSSQRETRMLYSPDGEHWGQCMVVGTTGERQAVLWGEEAFVGSLATEGAGFRRIELPEARLVKPLALSRSTDNLLRADVPAPTGGLDNLVTIAKVNSIADLPPGVPPPPCDPGNMFLIDNRSLYGRLGLWRPVTDAIDAPPPKGSAMLRAWVYAVPPEPGSDHPLTTPQLAARFWNDAGPQMGEWSGRMEFDAGAWVPLTLWTRWDGMHDSTTIPEAPWRPTVTLRAANAEPVYAPSRILLAWEGVYLDPPTVQGFGLPGGETGATEHAAVDGWDVGDDWTMLLVGMVPDDQWDNRVGGTLAPGVRTSSPFKPQLFELTDQAGNSVRVLADPPLEGVRVASSIGGRDREVSLNRTTYWLRGSPVLAVVRGSQGKTTVEISVGGSEPRRLTLLQTLSPSSVTLGPDPTWWYTIEAMPHAMRDNQISKVFHEMQLFCPTDFNRDGQTNSRDLIEFLNAWSAQQPDGDYNRDGFHNTQDVILYLADYAMGC